MAIAAVEVSRLNKSFRPQRKALDNVSLRIEPGEMVALIGASGSGKSTLLRHLSGFVAAEEGDIAIFGRTVQRNGRIASDVRAIRSDLGFVFQQFNLVGRLPVITNVMTGALFRMPLWRSLLMRFDRTTIDGALLALASVGLSEQAWQRASTLSGGQQQRVALARTLVQKARIILADEPIASLDPESARNVMDILSRMNREGGQTVLVSLHQVEMALRYCPRTIALHAGRVVYDGPSAALTPGMLRDLYGTAVDELYEPQPAQPHLSLVPDALAA